MPRNATLGTVLDDLQRWGSEMWGNLKRRGIGNPIDDLKRTADDVAGVANRAGRAARKAPEAGRTLGDLLRQSQEGYRRTLDQAPESLRNIQKLKEGRSR